MGHHQEVKGFSMFSKFVSVATLVLVASGVSAETNLDILKSKQAPANVLIHVKNKEIPASSRTVKGLYDQEKYGDWLLDVSRFDAEIDARSAYIPDTNVTHIYTNDKKNRGYMLILSCSSGLISDDGTNYGVLASIQSNIHSDNGIKDSSKYYYTLDDGEIKVQASIRQSDKKIAMGATSGKVMDMIKLFKSGGEVSGMLDGDSSKQVFQFSLKGFTKAYNELNNRCLKFSYVTYNRVFR